MDRCTVWVMCGHAGGRRVRGRSRRTIQLHLDGTGSIGGARRAGRPNAATSDSVGALRIDAIGSSPSWSSMSVTPRVGAGS
jgi:hypothetical protein